MTPPIMRPIVNLNGTSREELIEQRVTARVAVWELLCALAKLRPHARDYGDRVDRYKEDLKIHNERYAHVDRLYNVLEREALAIQESGK